MSPNDARRRLADYEDNFTERKPESANAGELRRTLVAFANSVPPERSAILFIGVHDNGQILGCSNPDATQKTIRKIAEQDCYPPITFSSK